MRPLVIAEIVALEGTRFISAQLFGEDGQHIECVMMPIQHEKEALDIVKRLAEVYSYRHIEVWTSNPKIYMHGIGEVGVYVCVKHPLDTASANRMVDDHKDALIEIYDLLPQEPLPPLPRWRQLLLRPVKFLVKKLEGNGKYEV